MRFVMSPGRDNASQLPFVTQATKVPQTEQPVEQEGEREALARLIAHVLKDLARKQKIVRTPHLRERYCHLSRAIMTSALTEIARRASSRLTSSPADH